MKDEEIREKAIAFAKKNKQKIAKESTDPKKFHPDERPISVFMAGSPGAGKTEFSKSLIDIIEGARRCNVVRIDADEIRLQMPNYIAGNAHLFQRAISIVVEKIHDLALSQKQTFILDGTLANYEKAVSNIERSFIKKRRVFIFYLYQRPEVAWKFTEAREAVEGRNIPQTVFIEQFIAARNNVEQLRNKYGENLVVFLVKKNFEKNTVEEVVDILTGDNLDQYINERYTEEDIKKLL